MGNGSRFIDATFGNYFQEDAAFGVKLLDVKSGQRKNPHFSHTPDTMYAHRKNKNKKDKPGKEDVVQISVYKNHERVLDIDWGHDHNEFKEGEIHVHIYKDGCKTKEYREPTPEEVELVNKVKERWNEKQ